MSADLSVISVIAVLVGLMFILSGVFSDEKLLLPSNATATDLHEMSGPAMALDQRRIKIRLGLVLIILGSILALPSLIGEASAPAILIILACLLYLLMAGYWRHANQLRTKPKR